MPFPGVFLFLHFAVLKKVRQLAEGLEIVKYPAGARILTKGDAGTTFYIIKEVHTLSQIAKSKKQALLVLLCCPFFSICALAWSSSLK